MSRNEAREFGFDGAFGGIVTYTFLSFFLSCLLLVVCSFLGIAIVDCIGSYRFIFIGLPFFLL